MVACSFGLRQVFNYVQLAFAFGNAGLVLVFACSGDGTFSTSWMPTFYGVLGLPFTLALRHAASQLCFL